MNDSERLRIGLVSSDAKLRAKFKDFASTVRAKLVVPETFDDAQSLMSGDDVNVRVIDYAAKKLLPPTLVRAHAFLGGKTDDVVVVFAGASEGDNERRVAFARKRVELVFEEIKRAVPAEKPRDAADEMLGVSDEMNHVRAQIRHIARFRDVPVMILGETGTGKELAADAIHRLGVSDEPIVAVNCAAIPSELVESELFGHEAGAYTGARTARVGLLEAAAQGTIFLDEIGEMPLVLQPKLLRALEQRRFRRVGATTDTAFRARIVSATNRALEGAALRPDLRYRLAGFTISLPPLRERAGDVELLAQAFLEDFGDRHKLSPIWFTTEALALLRKHPWPGNVRELRGVVQHAAIVAAARAVGEDSVSQALSQGRVSSPAEPAHQMHAAQFSRGAHGVRSEESSSSLLRDRERDIVVDAFRSTGGNVSQTARMLGIARATLRDRLKKYRVRA